MKKLYTALILITLIFLAITAQAATVQVSWNANSEEDLVGYVLYYGTESGNYTESVDVGNVTSYILELDIESNDWFFALKAYDESNRYSVYSKEADTVAPAAPTGIKAVIQAVVSWFNGLFGLRVKVV